jgi:DNA helicase II / ATP-dependent DNA helicase PcrA
MFQTLSDLQKKIVFEKSGKSVIRACPGSGKTYSISAKFAYLISEWKNKTSGIATISFTNTAWKEIENKLVNDFGITTPVMYPHFLGTIDSFINKFIFLPFGHLIMGCEKRPTLVGEPHGSWIGGRYDRDYEIYFDKSSYDISGELIPTMDLRQYHFRWKNKDGAESGHVKHIERIKNKYWRLGFATQDDANFIALKILETFPGIAKSIVYRFPQIIVDEAQDTSEIQMGILDLLILNGLEDIMMVGDPDQAIFEWNDAKPELFNDKFRQWQKNSIVLNENRRSSTNICNFTYNLSSLENPSVPVNQEVKDYRYTPNVVVFHEDINKTIDSFLEQCTEHNIQINKENVAVIYRSNDIYNQITQQRYIPDIEQPWITGQMFAKELSLGKYLYENGKLIDGYKIVEKAIYKVLFKTNYCSEDNLKEFIEKVGFTKHRIKILNFVNLLPSTDCFIVEWIKRTNQIFKEKGIVFRLNIRNDKGNVPIAELFKQNSTNNSLEYRTGTVHTTKGETFEAVLLFLKRKGAKGAYYKTLLNNGLCTTDNEELRIAYVGMTRPRKLLMLAVPTEEDKKAWESRLNQGT